MSAGIGGMAAHRGSQVFSDHGTAAPPTGCRRLAGYSRSDGVAAMPTRTVLVTGASRGIGLATAATARGERASRDRDRSPFAGDALSGAIPRRRSCRQGRAGPCPGCDQCAGETSRRW